MNIINQFNGSYDNLDEYYVTPSHKIKNITKLLVHVLKRDNTSLKEYLKYKQDKINIQIESYDALFVAVRNYDTCTNLETVKILLDNGANVNSYNEINIHSYPLLSAIRNHYDYDLIKLLLDNGFVVSVIDNISSFLSKHGK